MRGVHEQREQLVQGQPLLPAVGQRRRLVVGVEHPRQVRQPEQRQHRQVGLAVAAVRRRVDHPDLAVVAPEHVAVPEVAVQPGRRLLGDQVGQPADDALDGSRPRSAAIAPRSRASLRYGSTRRVA